ncbi:MAG: hypothetical protein HUJ68_04665 [Clostridia bacterium]|nr:hypothetical protein [Clostridia bacterium]
MHKVKTVRYNNEMIKGGSWKDKTGKFGMCLFYIILDLCQDKRTTLSMDGNEMKISEKDLYFLLNLSKGEGTTKLNIAQQLSTLGELGVYTKGDAMTCDSKGINIHFIDAWTYDQNTDLFTFYINQTTKRLFLTPESGYTPLPLIEAMNIGNNVLTEKLFHCISMKYNIEKEYKRLSGNGEAIITINLNDIANVLYNENTGRTKPQVFTRAVDNSLQDIEKKSHFIFKEKKWILEGKAHKAVGIELRISEKQGFYITELENRLGRKTSGIESIFENLVAFNKKPSEYYETSRDKTLGLEGQYNDKNRTSTNEKCFDWADYIDINNDENPNMEEETDELPF